MPIPIGLNADAKFLGNAAAFYASVRGSKSLTLIDDLKNEHTANVRAENPDMLINIRDHYKDWEGMWELCPHEGKPQTPQRMFDVLTSHYRPDLKVWINFGNEPAQHGDDLKRAIDWSCEVVNIFVQNRVPVVARNVQSVAHTPSEMIVYKPLLKLLHDHQDITALGIHEYFTLLIWLGVGAGDWSNLLKFDGSQYRVPPPTQSMLSIQHETAHIGRYLMFVEAAKAWGLFPFRIFMTETGFDRVNGLPQLQALDNANGGQKVSGIQTLQRLLPQHAQAWSFDEAVYLQLKWLSETLPYVETLNFYNWSIEPEWALYNIAPFPRLLDLIRNYNQSIGSTPPVDDDPDAPIPDDNSITPESWQRLQARVKALEAWKDAREGEI